MEKRDPFRAFLKSRRYVSKLWVYTGDAPRIRAAGIVSILAGIRKELNLTASAGVAPNKFVAKLASDWKKPDGLFVIQPEEIDAFLLPLSIGRLPGVGKVKGDRLAKLGVKTVRQLRRELSKLEK